MKKENDYEEETKWIQEARQGDKEAMMRLLKKYEPLLRKLVAGETRLDWEDLLQDLTLAFLKGVKAYDSAKGVYFAYYIRRLLYWKKGDIIKTAAKRFRSEVHSLEGLEDIPDERVPHENGSHGSGAENRRKPSLLAGGQETPRRHPPGRQLADHHRPHRYEPRCLLPRQSPPLRLSSERKRPVPGYGGDRR